MRIHQRAAGSPFWIEQIAGGGGHLADPVEVVARRLATVGDRAVRLAETLAVVGRAVATSEVALLAAMGPAEAAAALDELADVGLVVTGGGTARIAHDLIRNGIIDGLPAHRLRQLHRQVAAWLQGGAGDDPRLGLEALEHVRRGGLPVMEEVLRLVTGPQRRLIGGEGLARLVELVESSPEVPVELRSSLLALAAELGEHQVVVQQAEALTAEAGDGAVSARARLDASRSLTELGRLAQAEECLARATSLPVDDPALAVEALAQRSVLDRLRGHSGKASAVAKEAVAAGRALAAAGVPGGTAAYLRALAAAADAALFSGDPIGMAGYNDEIVRAAQGVDDRLRLRGLAEGGLARRLMGRPEEAEAMLRRAYGEAKSLFLPQAVQEAGAILGAILLSLGRVSEARLLAEEVRALEHRLVELLPARAFGTVFPHLLEFVAGDWRAGADDLAAVADQVPAHYALHAHLERAVALARMEGSAKREALAAAEAALNLAEEVGCIRCLRESYLRCCEVWARSGDLPAARGLLDAASELRDPADRLAEWWLLRARHAVGDIGAASPEESLELLADEADRLGLVVEGMWARRDQARVLLESQDGRAAQVLRALAADADAKGVRTIAGLVDRALRALGVRTWRRGAHPDEVMGLAALTERERQLAVMAAAGASNPEIAATLFLSRRTVERHMSNVLAKLGLRNRTELAALIGQQVGGDHP